MARTAPATVGGLEQLSKMTPVGFEPTQLALVELESTTLDHSGKVSAVLGRRRARPAATEPAADLQPLLDQAAAVAKRKHP